MNILALESSGHTGSVAAAKNDRLLAEIALDPGQRSAQSLTPAVRKLLSDVGWTVRDIGIVAVTVGPGSFTGLRVGVATAKTLAYATKAKLVGVNTLTALAVQFIGETPRLSAVMDAQRGQVFAGEFERIKDRWQLIGEPTLMDNEQWLAELKPGTAVTGPALLKLVDKLPAEVAVNDPGSWSPRAGSVALLAWQRHLAGEYDDVWRLLPVYVRKSAAEEKWEQGSGARGQGTEGGGKTT